MAKTHDLKTWSKFFYLVLRGEKPFELRKDDRDFKVGDTLRLREYDPETGRYSGRECCVVVTCVVRDAPHFGLKDGYVILGFEPHKRIVEWIPHSLAEGSP